MENQPYGLGCVSVYRNCLSFCNQSNTLNVNLKWQNWKTAFVDITSYKGSVITLGSMKACSEEQPFVGVSNQYNLPFTITVLSGQFILSPYSAAFLINTDYYPPQGKVMFPEVCVSHSVHGVGWGVFAPRGSLLRGVGTLPPYPHPPVLTFSGGHCNDRHVSYWNTFLRVHLPFAAKEYPFTQIGRRIKVPLEAKLSNDDWHTTKYFPYVAVQL